MNEGLVVLPGGLLSEKPQRSANSCIASFGIELSDFMPAGHLTAARLQLLPSGMWRSLQHWPVGPAQGRPASSYGGASFAAPGHLLQHLLRSFFPKTRQSCLMRVTWV